MPLHRFDPGQVLQNPFTRCEASAINCYLQYIIISLQENDTLINSRMFTTCDLFRSNISAIDVIWGRSLSGVQNATEHPISRGEFSGLNLLIGVCACPAIGLGRRKDCATQGAGAHESELHGPIPDDLLHGKGSGGHRYGASCFSCSIANLQRNDSPGDIHFGRRVVFVHGWQSNK